MKYVTSLWGTENLFEFKEKYYKDKKTEQPIVSGYGSIRQQTPEEIATNILFRRKNHNKRHPFEMGRRNDAFGNPVP